MNVQELFKLAMKRDIPELLVFPGVTYNIGSSPTDTYKIEGAIPLGFPDWGSPWKNIPADHGTVSTIHCYHFMEHLAGTDAIKFLRECERVMIPGASVLNFCVPYYSSSLQAQDLTHKSVWCEDSFKTLLENPYYKPTAGEWKLKVHFQMIAGIVGRNICMIGQLVKT